MDKIEVKLKCYELAQVRSTDPVETLARAKTIHEWVSDEAHATSAEADKTVTAKKSDNSKSREPDRLVGKFTPSR